MGQLLAKLGHNGDGTTTSINIDFQNAQPNDRCRAVYDSCEAVLQHSETVLAKLSSYGEGAGPQIRAALSSPSEENDALVWAALTPKVLAMKEMHDYGTQLSTVFSTLFSSICAENIEESIQDQEALAKQLASIYNFVMKFDQLKMVTPQLSNDFAFYRRSLGKVPPGTEKPVSDEDAAALSMYYAWPTPMMTMLTQAAQAVSTSVLAERVTMLLGLTASVCQSMVHRKIYTDMEMNALLLRCMVASIVLFDHVDPKGAFQKKSSSIPTKKCIQELKAYEDPGVTEGLLNTLRYSTKHLNDSDTSSSIQELLK